MLYASVTILLSLFLAPGVADSANALTPQTAAPPTDETRLRERDEEKDREGERNKKGLSFQQRSMTTHERAHSSARWVSHLSYPGSRPSFLVSARPKIRGVLIPFVVSWTGCRKTADEKGNLFD